MGLSRVFLVIVWCVCHAPTSSCPARCRCVSTTSRPSADCSYQELKFVPTDLPSNLTQLSLSVNHISALNTTSFAKTLGITSLWLANNQIVTIALGTFWNLTQLMNLDISHNHLLDFPWSDLSTLHKLQILILNNNQLVNLPLSTFSNTKELRSLQLSNNHFSTIAEGTLQPLSALSHIQLHSNPFNCSCQLMWLKDWLEKNKLTIDRRKEIACSAPKEFRGVSLDHVPGAHCKIPSAIQGDEPFMGKINLLCKEAGISKLIVNTNFQRLNDYKKAETANNLFANGTISIHYNKQDMIYLCRVSNHTSGAPKEISISFTHAEVLGWLQEEGQKFLLVLVANNENSGVKQMYCSSGTLLYCWITVLMVHLLAHIWH
ncbi:immunoglobulin superfamily containing leucine-rich repeat protein 2-like [Xenopus tropicalis]|uniref:immunoglobulin superfamily containing leucine-rich repeat protein 2-like n=1 Tax=Xenopus tropicalis TaxID=8364 RepID=UPI0012F70769|nr:immunoglobulin superfamily containing leucine-rich repeat protein 2-like [Xenopus tropicalis]